MCRLAVGTGRDEKSGPVPPLRQDGMENPKFFIAKIAHSWSFQDKF